MDLDLVGPEDAGLKGPVGGLERDRGAATADSLQCHLVVALDQGDDDVAGVGGLGLLNHRYVAVENAGLDRWVVAFTSLVSLLAVFVFGLTPAIFASRPDLSSALKDGARSSSARGGRLRAAFIVVQVALAIVLLAGAGLLIRSFAALLSVDPGFKPEHVLTLQISLPGSGKYSEEVSRVQFFRELAARVERLPGVTAAGAVSFLPLTGLAAATRLTIVGKPAPPQGQEPVADVRLVSGDYFRAMGIPLIKGRLFDEHGWSYSLFVTDRGWAPAEVARFYDKRADVERAMAGLLRGNFFSAPLRKLCGNFNFCLTTNRKGFRHSLGGELYSI